MELTEVSGRLAETWVHRPPSPTRVVLDEATIGGVRWFFHEGAGVGVNGIIGAAPALELSGRMLFRRRGLSRGRRTISGELGERVT
jgi:hypothetical protein